MPKENKQTVNKKYHKKIIRKSKEHKFCKEFNCPPYPSLKDTPANVIDEFTIIQEEINNFTSKDKK